MPSLVPTPLGPDAEAAIDMIGNRSRAAILGHLMRHGPAVRGDIAAALDMVPGTVSNQLTILMSAGLVTTDPPPDMVRPGIRVRYAVNPDRLAAIYRDLGEALGLID